MLVRCVFEVLQEDGSMERHPITLHENMAIRFLFGGSVKIEVEGYDGEFISSVKVEGKIENATL